MRKIQIFVLFFMFNYCLQAQTYTVYNPKNTFDFSNKYTDIDYSSRVRKLKEIKNTGIVLTGVGTIAAGVGFHLILKNNAAMACSRRMPDGYYTGKKVGIAGLVGVGAGVTMWVISGTKLKNLKKKIQIDAGVSNASLIYRF